MKILFDLVPFSFSHHSGVFQYALRILKGWHNQGIGDVTVMTTPWLANNVISQVCPSYKCLMINEPHYKKRFLNGLCLSVQRSRIVNNLDCDVVFYPMPEPYFFFPLKKKQVGVLHDTSFETSPWYVSRLFIPLQLRLHSSIIAITEYTKQKALEIYPFLKSKSVNVVHNCIDFCDEDAGRFVSGRYILCVNTLYKYKNADTLIRAFSHIKDMIPHKLILVGADVENRRSELYDLASRYGIKDRFIIFQNVRESELVSLYRHADLFVSPSTMEGFGQTPIEAAMYGCPVITTKETALPESTMGIVNYYSPSLSYENLALKIIEVIYDKEKKKEELKKIAMTFVREYDIVKQSKAVYDVLSMVTNEI